MHMATRSGQQLAYWLHLTIIQRQRIMLSNLISPSQSSSVRDMAGPLDLLLATFLDFSRRTDSDSNYYQIPRHFLPPPPSLLRLNLVLERVLCLCFWPPPLRMLKSIRQSWSGLCLSPPPLPSSSALKLSITRHLAPRLSSCLPVIPNGLDKQWKHKSVDNCSYDTKSSDNVPNWPSLISSKALAACSLLCPRSMIVDSVSAWWAPEATLEQLEHISGFGGMIESHCGQDG